MTPAAINKRFPYASRAFIQANSDADDSRQVAVVERDSGDAPLAKEKVQGSTRPRFLARFTSIRKRLIDESNLCYKFHEDFCRYAGALPDDSPEICHSEVRQKKALKGEIERTVVEIIQL